MTTSPKEWPVKNDPLIPTPAPTSSETDIEALRYRLWVSEDQHKRLSTLYDELEAERDALRKALEAIVARYKETQNDECRDLPRPVLRLLMQIAASSALLDQPPLEPAAPNNSHSAAPLRPSGGGQDAGEDGA